MSADTFEKTLRFKIAKAMTGVPDTMQEKHELQRVADPTLRKLGSFAPAPRADENNFDYMARIGEHVAVFGPEDRKGVDRYSSPPSALAEWVKQDLAIAEAEIEHPRYLLNLASFVRSSNTIILDVRSTSSIRTQRLASVLGSHSLKTQ